jgi:hypothetical protein
MENKRNVWLLPTDKPSILFKDDFDKYFISKNIDQEQNHFTPQNIYITSDSEIKEGDWFIYRCYKVCKCTGLSQSKQILTNKEIAKHKDYGKPQGLSKKIILTTDQAIIADGVQEIDDEFIEWFVNNPSCDRIDFVLINDIEPWYKISFPKEEPNPFELPKALPDDVFFKSLEEPKQEEINFIIKELNEERKRVTKKETLEKTAFKKYPRSMSEKDSELRNIFSEGLELGAKLEQQRMYSEANKIISFLDNEYKLGISDKQTIERLKWYFETYFEQFKKK